MQHHQFGAGCFSQRHCLGQNSFTIGLTQRALPHDHHAISALGVLGERRFRAGQFITSRAEMCIIICQINSFADQANLRTSEPCLADTRIQNRRLIARVGSHQHHKLGAINVFDRCSADIGRAISGRQLRAVRPALNAPTHAFDHLLERKRRFDRRQITHEASNSLTFHRGGGSCKRLPPARLAQLAVLTNVGCIQTLAPQSVPNKARLVGNPFLVHAVMVARQEAHHFAPLRVHTNVRAKRVHHVDGFGLGQLPRTRCKCVGLRYQRTDGAQINDVALHVAFERLTQIAGDLRILATARLAHLANASDLGGEAHATCAGNAAGHMGFNERPKIEIFRRPLRLAETAKVDAIGHRLILQVTLATLIADRAIQRVVDQQKFHHAFARLLHHRRIGLHDGRLPLRTRPQITHLHGAAGGGLRRAANNFNKAHAAVTGNRQPLMIAEAGHFDSRLFTGLNQGHAPWYFQLVSIDDDFAQIRHGQPIVPVCMTCVSRLGHHRSFAVGAF